MITWGRWDLAEGRGGESNATYLWSQLWNKFSNILNEHLSNAKMLSISLSPDKDLFSKLHSILNSYTCLTRWSNTCETPGLSLGTICEHGGVNCVLNTKQHQLLCFACVCIYVCVYVSVSLLAQETLMPINHKYSIKTS